MVDLPMEKMPEYYSVPLKCVNCQCKFIDDDPSMYAYADVVPEAINIAKGVKISDCKCPVCGCQTLARWITHTL